MGGFEGWSCDDIPDRWSPLFVNRREMKDCLQVNWDFVKGNDVKDDVLVDMDVRMEIEVKNVSKLTQALNLPPFLH